MWGCMPHSSLFSFAFTILKLKIKTQKAFPFYLVYARFDSKFHSFCLWKHILGFKLESMVELQSCASSLVNASALCAIEQEVKGESAVNVMAEISAELQREREKNAQLMERISVLEAQLQGRHKDSIVPNGQDSGVHSTERSLKKFKRQRIDTFQNVTEERHATVGEVKSQIKIDTPCNPSKVVNMEDGLVNWMSMDETQFLHFDKLKDDDLAADCDDTDDSDEEEDCQEVDTHTDHENGETNLNTNLLDETPLQSGADSGTNTANLGIFSGQQNVPAFLCMNEETSADRKDYCILADPEQTDIKRHLHKLDKKEPDTNGYRKTLADDRVSGKEAYRTGPGNISSIRKPLKMAFCPKEVRRILMAEDLTVKNTQYHTIRKIIVFASLGIRHGCDDMYELDFNHFSILRKGEPYLSANDPGEHVLYENPGVRRKIFYPNRQNPTLCPVQILEEEKAMRPSDPSCPSCLFLCLKYGGRTRNLPQNEYVRQRMGRNKLKSFGPVMCRMATLVHIRYGSFFFKALGITLLFMAGFPGDLVQRETKYRNLDLLQKYYRTDEDAEGEKLFLSHPLTCDIHARPSSEKLTGKTASTQSKGKKQVNSINKPNSSPRISHHQSVPSNTASSTEFGLAGYTSNQTRAMASFQPIPPQIPHDTLQVFPPQPMPMVYWCAPNAFPPSPYTSTYGYQAFPSSANYISTHPHLYHIHPSYYSLIPKAAETNCKNGAALEEADADSDSSSSSTEPKRDNSK